MTQAKPDRQDRIYAITRVLGAIVIPFLALAAVILFLFPSQTGERFAWPVKPPLTAMLMASAYAGGVYFFSLVLAGRRWLSVKHGFLPVAVFAGLLGVATILHWDRFTHGHIAFIFWVILYFSTPFLVFSAWLYNQRENPSPRPGVDLTLTASWRIFFALQAAGTLSLAAAMYLAPTAMIPVWPWSLTPLTARVMGAMFAIPGVLGLEIVLDPRWAAARRLLEAQLLSFSLILVAFLRARSDFNTSDGTYAAFLGAVGLILILVGYLLIRMRGQVRKYSVPQPDNSLDVT